jgi:deazaflavin-dependent oxidoreductase (nitroreductase family)
MEKPNITIPPGKFPLLGLALHSETVVQRILLFV